MEGFMQMKDAKRQTVCGGCILHLDRCTHQHGLKRVTTATLPMFPHGPRPSNKGGARPPPPPLHTSVGLKPSFIKIHKWQKKSGVVLSLLSGL